MGRLRLKPPPGPGDLASTPVHEVIRDYPEALPVLRRLGIDAAEVGGRPLGGAGTAEVAVPALLAATSWRRPSRPPP